MLLDVNEIINDKGFYSYYQLLDNKIIKNKIDNQLNQVKNHLIIKTYVPMYIKNVEEPINNEVEKAIKYCLKKYGPTYGMCWGIMIYIKNHCIMDINAKKLNCLYNYVVYNYSNIDNGEDPVAVSVSLVGNKKLLNMELRSELNNQLISTFEELEPLKNNSFFVSAPSSFSVAITTVIEHAHTNAIKTIKDIIESSDKNDLWGK